MIAQPKTASPGGTQRDSQRARLAELYETDYAMWLFENAALLRAGHLDELDGENIAEELEDMGRSEARAVGSHIEVLILHLLKWQFQPHQRSGSWRGSILQARYAISDLLDDSPSLRNKLEGMVTQRYPRAVRKASAETGLSEQTFPVTLPYAIDDLLSDDYWPD
jgi:hypothetical protein